MSVFISKDLRAPIIERITVIVLIFTINFIASGLCFSYKTIVLASFRKRLIQITYERMKTGTETLSHIVVFSLAFLALADILARTLKATVL